MLPEGEALDPLIDTFSELARDAANALTAREWQPIDTAPQDGSTIVLGGYGWTRRGYWAVDNFIGNGRPTWSSEDGHGCGEVTHWMPLPEPPLPQRAPSIGLVLR